MNIVWAKEVGLRRCAFEPKATHKHALGPGTTQKDPKVNSWVPRSKEVTFGRQSELKTVQHMFRGTSLLARSSTVLRQPTEASLAELIAHSGTQRETDEFPTHQVLLRVAFLHAPGARMTVVELTPTNDHSKTAGFFQN